jgi:alanyl-tRNA synthetase
MMAEAKEIGGLRVLARRVPDGTQSAVMREIAEKLRDKLGDHSVVFVGAVVGDKAQLCVMVSKAATAKVKAGDLIKAVAKIVGGSGGGRPDMAQAGGTEIGKIDEAIAAVHGEVARLVGS